MGIQWSNLHSGIGGENLAIGAVLTMLLFDSMLYFSLAYYLNAVVPGDYGTTKPWYFPLMVSCLFVARSEEFHIDMISQFVLIQAVGFLGGISHP